MKKALSVMVLALLALPAFAQDDFGGGGFGGDAVFTGSDIDALLGGGNRGNRGNNNNQDQIPNPETLLLQVKDLLKAKKVPLSKDQEKVLKTFLETETVTMRTELEAQFGNRGNNNRGNNNNNNTANMLTEIFAAVGKTNAALLTSMKADLTPDQVSLISKAEKDKKVCSVMVDLVNPQQLQNRNNEGGGRGGRGNNNNNNSGNFNFPAGLEEFFPQQQNNNYNNRGNNSWLQNAPDRTFCTSGTSTTAERLAPIAQILTKGKKPLTADQEKKFAGMIEVAVPKMQEELRATNPEMQRLLSSINQNNQNNQNRNNNNNQNNNNPPAVNLATLRSNIVGTIMTQLGLPNNNNNNNNNNRGNRGGGNNPQNNNPQNNQNTNATANNTNAASASNATAAGNASANNDNFFNRGGRGNNNNFNPQAEVRKRNEELYDKIAAKLDSEQGKVVKKYKYDQIKARGGAERWRGIMLEEGTPLTPEQSTTITQLINANNQLTRNYADQLVDAEMKAVGSFDLPPNTPNLPNGNRPNPNNVPQNPAAQKVVAKIMPEVSKRHAALDRGLEETILKTLTPPQVASYKLNKM
jgi:hypothetical protein